MLRRRPRHACKTAVLGVAAALVALGAAPAAAERVPPEQWVNELCTSIVTWTDELVVARSQFDPNEPDLRARRRGLVTYLETATESTRGLLRQLKQAGTPDMTDGRKIARAFKEGIRRTRRAFASAARDAAELRPRNAERFEQGQSDINQAILDAREEINKPFEEVAEKYDTSALDAAFDSVPACTGGA